MKDWIKRKIDEIEQLYPKDRIEKSKQRYRDIWSGKKCDRIPFVYYPFLFDYYNDFNSFDNPDERLGLMLDECIIHGHLKDDFIPSLFPGCRQSTIPNMFGAEEVVVDGNHSCKKIINEIEDIVKLPEPSISKGTVAYKWLELEKYYLEETQGKLPVHICDMQGPFDVAGQLMGYDLMLMTPYIDPDYYHKLMEKITSAYIDLWNNQKNVLGDNFIGTHLFGWNWIPENMGATLSADSIVMVSKEFFVEFYKPYMTKISEAMGGIVIHSCGQFGYLMDEIKSLPNIRGLNAGQMTIEEMVKAGLDRSLAVICLSIYSNVEQTLKLVKENSLKADLTVKIDFVDEIVLRNKDIMHTKVWELIKRKEEELLRKLLF